MTQTTFLSTLIFVMVTAGALGGVVNYFLTPKADTKADPRADPEERSIAKSIVVGIAAAFLVPLFLNMISSNLTEEIRGTQTGAKARSRKAYWRCVLSAFSTTCRGVDCRM